MPGSTVGIVITTFNYGHYLEECLRSLDAQTRPPDEVVIVDDASTDETPQVLGRLLPQLRIGDRIRVIRHAARQGQASSTTEGIQACSCELVAHVDADDICEQRYVQRLSEAMSEDPSAGYAYPRMRLIGTENGIYASFAFDPARLLFEGNYIPNVALVRRDAYLAVGGIRELTTHVDWDLWLSMLDRGWHGVLVDEVLYNWRRHPGSLSDRSQGDRLRARLNIWWRHRRLVARHLASAPRWLVAAAWRRVRLRLPGEPALLRTRSAWIENPNR